MNAQPLDAHRPAARARFLRASAAMALAGLALAGCSKAPPKDLPPAPATAPYAGQSQAPQSQGAMPGSQADFVNQMMGKDTIYFALDRFTIDPAAQAALQGQAAWLMRYPSKRATIEGYADERGTREYNLALGERRATAAKNYLVSLGVDAGRLNVISYGKDRPIALGSNEEAWARNRRAVTVTLD